MQTLFRPEAVSEKRQKLRGSLVLAQPLGMNIIVVCVSVVIMAAVAYFSSFEYARTETVSGFVTTSGGVVSLGARYGGILTQRYVDVGDIVQPNQALFESSIDTDTQGGRSGEGLLAATELRLNEISRQISIATRRYESQTHSMERQKVRLAALVGRVIEQLRLRTEILAGAEVQLAKVRALHKTKFASEIDVNRQLELALTHRSDVAGLDARVAEIRSDIELLDLELQRLPDRFAQDISELTIRQNGLHQAKLQQQAQTSYIVRAPVAGRVSSVQGAAGQQLRPDAPVVTILPEDAGLVVHLLAPSRTVGLVASGDDVELKVDAFPYQQFGLLPAAVSGISQSPFMPGDWDTPIRYNEPVYKVVVALERDYVFADGKKRSLMVGMTLTGDIVVDRRRLIDWILEPLLPLQS